MERFPEGGHGVEAEGLPPVWARQRTSAAVVRLVMWLAVGALAATSAATTSSGTVRLYEFALVALVAVAVASNLVALLSPPRVQLSPTRLTVITPGLRRTWAWSDCGEVTLTGRRRVKAVRVSLKVGRSSGGSGPDKVLLPLHLDMPPERLAELVTLYRHTYGGLAQG